MAIKDRAAFNRERRVNNVTFDTGCRCELDLTGANAAIDAAADDDRFRQHFTGYGGFLADDQRSGANITFNGSVELHFAFGINGSGDYDVTGQD